MLQYLKQTQDLNDRKKLINVFHRWKEVAADRILICSKDGRCFKFKSKD